jgi:DNA-binding transcriptional MocR family regulator
MTMTTGMMRFSVPVGYQPAPLAVTRVLANLARQRKEAGHNDISFGGGLPNPAACDVEGYEAKAKAYLARLADHEVIPGCRTINAVQRALANYTDTVSHTGIRQDFARPYARDTQIPINVERLIPTLGNTQAIMATLMFFNSLGKKVAVFVEQQAYTGLLSAAEWFQNIKVISLPMTEDGMSPFALKKALKFVDDDPELQQGFVYLVPDGGNPSGITMSQQRRDDLYNTVLMHAQETGNIAYIFEDSPYYFIRLGKEGQEYPLPMAANDPAGIVAHAFSASKISFPDNRVGWLHLPMEWDQKDATGKNRMLYGEVAAAVAAGTLIHSSRNLAGFNGQMWNADEMVGLMPASATQSAIYRQNAGLLYEAIETGLVHAYPDLFALSPRPQHGFVFSITMPDLEAKTGIKDDVVLAQRLLDDHGVIVTPMSGFAPPDLPAGALSETIRLAFSAETPERIEEGAERLVTGLKAVYGLG